jgi:hypothetical protein
MSLLYPSVISSIVEVIITQPLDVIKIHKQTNTPIIFNIKNLYQGLFIRASGNIPSRSVFLYSQEYFKNYYFDNEYKIFLIPFMSTLSQTLIDTPIEILKINKIMNINNKFLYKGFVPHFSRNFIFLASVFNFKEQVSLSKEKVQDSSIYKKALYGAVGGLVGSYISHPLDTIKTFKQSNMIITSDMYKFNMLMKGCHLRASMSFINMMISLSIFEFIKILNIF